MRIGIVTNSAARAPLRGQACRWARLLADLGQRVALLEESGPTTALSGLDLLLVLEPRPKQILTEHFRRTRRGRPQIVFMEREPSLPVGRRRAERSPGSLPLRRPGDPVRERRALRQLLGELTRDSDGRFRMIDCSPDIEPNALVDFAAAVAAGFEARPRRLPCRYLYDDEGSLLFEQICELPEYYVTRAERQILRARAGEIAQRLPGAVDVVELGSGSAQKSRILLTELCRHGSVRYLPIDISRHALSESARLLAADLPSLQVCALAGEYQRGLECLPAADGSARLVLCLGSNIGNFERTEAANFLSSVGGRLAQGDRVLLGVDLRKDRRVLEAAYDDPKGVTARFGRNLLVRINRELGGDIDLERFTHRARYDEAAGRVDLFLSATRSQRFRVARLDREYTIEDGATIHTESSFKYAPMEIDELAQAAGLDVETRWLDDQRRFSLNLLAKN